MAADISVIILTKNEETNIERCVLSAKKITDKIFVVDSGSSDNTVKIVKKLGCDVIEHEFVSYAHQYIWALDNLPITTTWIFRLDADEIVTDRLADEIKEECLVHSADDVNGFIVSFKIRFLGKVLKRAALYPFLNLIIWKRGKGNFSERYMGEHVVLSEGKTITLKNYCEHDDTKSLDVWVKKHNWYSTREVVDYYARNGKNETKQNIYQNAKKTQKMRDGFYYRLPLFFRARLYFWYRYFLKLGFVDGKPGKIYCWLQAYWYRFLIDAKIYECEHTSIKYKDPGDLK